jgi:type II secretory pathway component GspD/PulD (secretin)
MIPLSHKDHTMLRTLLLLAALGMMSLYAFADEPKPDTKAEESAIIEVYRLKNADLNDAQQAFAALTGRSRRGAALGGGRAGGGVAKAARGGAGGPGGGAPGGPGRGGFGGNAFDPADEVPIMNSTGIVARGLADPRTRSLIVRGTQKDQQLAADLVAVLDTPEDKTLPAVKAIRAFRLQHLDADDLVAMLHQLDPNMGYRLAPIARMKLLLATGSDAQMKELTDAVKKLDIPSDMK